ncbi:MAG: FkbM family methyltransferase [Candidatus Latescibacterota bacterium]|nr:FkbM family methyltransferase [Candidatus Latescibacterota bacterium]
MKVFLRKGDIFSFAPLFEGVHEKPLTNLIEFFSEKNFSDYFIDIGANIGLSSCQNGSAFQKVICFEPNPLCANILRTNLAISLPSEKFIINEFALGEAEGNFELCIPKHNWGGAFIRSDDNAYSEAILASKDNFDGLDSDNYVNSVVQVKSTKDTFLEIFSNLRRKDLKKGIIKIDVEGFEEVVLLGIAEVLPSDFDVVIVFENFNENFDFIRLEKAFLNRKISLCKIENTIVNSVHSRLYQIVSLMLGKSDDHYLAKLNDVNSVVGDIVVEVS